MIWLVAVEAQVPVQWVKDAVLLQLLHKLDSVPGLGTYIYALDVAKKVEKKKNKRSKLIYCLSPSNLLAQPSWRITDSLFPHSVCRSPGDSQNC